MTSNRTNYESKRFRREGDGFEEFSSDINTIPEGATLGSEFTIQDGVLSSGDTWVDGELELVIPEGVVEISTNAFKDKCTIVTSLNFSESQAHTIGVQAFYNCKSLATIVPTYSIRNIEENAFRNCESLTSLDFSNTQLESIGESAFDGCPSLLSVSLSNNLSSLSEIRLFMGVHRSFLLTYQLLKSLL